MDSYEQDLNFSKSSGGNSVGSGIWAIGLKLASVFYNFYPSMLVFKWNGWITMVKKNRRGSRLWLNSRKQSRR